MNELEKENERLRSSVNYWRSVYRELWKTVEEVRTKLEEGNGKTRSN